MKVKVFMSNEERVAKIINTLEKLYPDAGCTLTYEDPLQLLISTMLAAQCTDERVNTITPGLFKKYKDACDFANADLEELKSIIKPTGFFRNKAANIIACCKMIVEKFNGRVPDNMEDLLKLPGVGRKTANLILGDVYGIPSIVVDTHCGRLARRIGFTKSEDPSKVEQDLIKIIPSRYRTRFCHQLVLHGRAVCKARKPECQKCGIRAWCDAGAASS